MSNDEEIWKDIPEYEGYYQISTLGNVRSLERLIIRRTGAQQLTRSVLLKPFTGKTSVYFQIRLCKKGVEHKYLVHRLVALAFLKDWSPLLEVNHIDGNKHNNRVENLEMCTRQENINHSVINGLKRDYGQNHVHAKLTNMQASQIRSLHEWGIRQVDLAKMFNVCKQTICSIIHNENYNK